MDDHRRLRDVARELKAHGVHVLISNSAAPAVRELYAEGFEIEEVLAGHAINARGDGRGRIPELIIR